MTDPSFYTAEAEIRKLAGVRRRIRLGPGAEFEVGVHGPIKDHYALDAEPDRPLPVDYVVGAGGA
jgi:hypothetical protein